MSIKIKICGITTPKDAATAVEAGADLLGFVFYNGSARHVAPDQAAIICRDVPRHVLRVGLFVNPTVERVEEAIHVCDLQMVQFHGDETPDFCRQFSVMTMKAFRVKGPGTLDRLMEYATDAWLLDAHVPGKFGGTGKTFDWQIAAQATQFGRPVFLAGGLTPDNVGAAIQTVRPYGVDVSGGVEVEPGRKDPQKVAAFVSAAKQVDVSH